MSIYLIILIMLVPSFRNCHYCATLGYKGSIDNFYFLRFLHGLVCRCINYTLTAYTLLMLFSIFQNSQNKLVLSPFRSFLSEKKVLSYIRNIEPFLLRQYAILNFCAAKDQKKKVLFVRQDRTFFHKDMDFIHCNV